MFCIKLRLHDQYSQRKFSPSPTPFQLAVVPSTSCFQLRSFSQRILLRKRDTNNPSSISPHERTTSQKSDTHHIVFFFFFSSVPFLLSLYISPVMAAGDNETDGHSFLQNTSILGLKVYTLLGICVGCAIALALLIIFSCWWTRNVRKRARRSSSLIPVVSKEIIAIKAADQSENDDKVSPLPKQEVKTSNEVKRSEYRSSESNVSGGSVSSSSAVSSDMPHFGWGRWYPLRELELATDGFSAENVIGEGGYGIVYRGVLPDSSIVAIKNLLNNKGQAEREFKVEVEAIGKVRHKNLVRLIGYCAEGTQRMLVYEFVENGNLEQWLHGDVGPSSPLTWDIRMKIAIETAKGLAYLHEGLEPKVVHRDVKSSNILLDKQWNPKVSDFGLAKLLGSESSYVTTRVMGTFGYVAPEYASTGMLSEGSDVYSFGVLLMEIISGRSPVDYGRPAGEVNLVEWFKGMVGSRRGEEVVDPLIEMLPPPRALKRVLLVCLRCIDLDAQKRPKMGQVVHMLEADEFPFRTELRSARGETQNAVRGEKGRNAIGIPLPSRNLRGVDLGRVG